MKATNRRETWCVGTSAAFLGEEIGGLGSIIPPYERSRPQHSGGDDENDFPDFSTLDSLSDLSADNFFARTRSLSNTKSHGFITARLRDPFGQSLPQATIEHLVEADSEGGSSPGTPDVEAVRQLTLAREEIEEVGCLELCCRDLGLPLFNSLNEGSLHWKASYQLPSMKEILMLRLRIKV